MQLSDSLSFDEVDAEKYDAFVFVGGGGAYQEYYNNPDYLELAKRAKLLAAICIAPSLLASGGLLKGKEVTGRDDGRGTEITFLQEN
jgi:putative intracellular protease/amidase